MPKTKMQEHFQTFFAKSQDTLARLLPEILMALLILMLFVAVGWALRRLARKRLINRIEDPLLVNFTGRLTFLIFLITGLIIALNIVGLGKAAGGLLAGAGVSAIILGFAFKDIGENFIAGFFLAFSRPFHIGDVIEVSGIKGMVKALNFRNTHVRTFDGQDIYIPNAMLIKNPLSNYTRDGLQRFDFVIGLDYEHNPLEAGKELITALESLKEIEHGGELQPFVQLEEFGTSTVNIRVYYWINSKNFTGLLARLRSQVLHTCLDALQAKGYNLPADIIEIKNYPSDKPFHHSESNKAS